MYGEVRKSFNYGLLAIISYMKDSGTKITRQDIADGVLPPQTSSEDTSNWDDRAFVTPNDSREVVFRRAKPTADVVAEIVNPYLEQEQRKAEKRSQKLSK